MNPWHSGIDKFGVRLLHGTTELAIAAERAQLGLIGYPDIGGARPLNQRVLLPL